MSEHAALCETPPRAPGFRLVYTGCSQFSRWKRQVNIDTTAATVKFSSSDFGSQSSAPGWFVGLFFPLTGK